MTQALTIEERIEANNKLGKYFRINKLEEERFIS